MSSNRLLRQRQMLNCVYQGRDGSGVRRPLVEDQALLHTGVCAGQSLLRCLRVPRVQPTCNIASGRIGISDLRFASPGRLVGRVAEDKDLLDVVAFDLAAEDLLGARVSLFSDRVLDHDNVSKDLVDAQPL